MNNRVGCVEYKPRSYYHEYGILKSKSLMKYLAMTDEYLDYLGDYFQDTCAKHERGWTFYDWLYEYIGMKLVNAADQAEKENKKSQ